MSSSLPNIDWREIRPLNGSREGGFEEMCTQLARLEIPPDSLFERKGTPDAGVECHAILPNGREWGWQAKYFATLRTSQWSQLDASVKTALEKHPKLDKYFVCIPLNRADAKINGHKSAKERWDERVEKWKRWASDRGMHVDFVWVGSHELIEQLLRTQNAGLVRFWFDNSTFDPSWFQARFEEARKTAGPRYTPEIHVDLPIAQVFEALGRTRLFFDIQKGQAKELKKRLNHFVHERSDPPDAGLDALTSALRTQVESILSDLGAIRYLPTASVPFETIADKLAAVENSAEEILKLVSKRERDYSQHSSPAGESSRGRGNPFTSQRFRLYELTGELRKIGESLRHATAVACNPLMILRGDPGTGKTHLLCDIAHHRLQSGKPTILLMGQRFISADGPWSQALQQLDLTKLSGDEFVGALEAAAQAKDCRALVFIDALNEGNGRHIWPTNLAAFLAQLERSAWISVVLSIRTSYEDVVIPDEIRERAYTTTHHGFIDHGYSAVKTFFQHYELELPSTPLLSPEFNNPLFLKTLCVGLKENGEHRLPRGSQGVTTVFNLYLASANKRLASSLDLPLEEVVSARFRLRDAASNKIHDHLLRANTTAFQRMLLPDGGNDLEVSPAICFSYPADQYPANPYYSGRYIFPKHFYEKPGQLNSEEERVAILIDGMPEIKHWVRNLVRQSNCGSDGTHHEQWRMQNHDFASTHRIWCLPYQEK